MPKYITLLNWTDQGIRNIKESPARLDAAKEMFESAGAKLEQFFLVTGKYDMVAIVEAPDDETAATVSLAVGSRGAARTETLRAFTENEYRKMIADLP